MSLSSAQLNAALRAYVSTFPRHDRLLSHLRDAGLDSKASEIEARLRTALDAAEKYLWGQKDGVGWTEDFEERLFEHLRLSSPWLDREGFSSILSFGKWLCWHEGLDARDANQ